jgi:hypothetical protein
MHPMKRAFLIFVFGLGTVGGFAHGFASLAGGHCGSHWRNARRASYEDHMAEVCTRAAYRVSDEREAVHEEARDEDRAAVAPAPSGVSIHGPAVITVTAPE